MAIFNKDFFPVQEQKEYPNIDGTIECGYEIATESYRDINNLLAGLYVSDVMIESAVYEGATNAQALIEGAMGDFYQKTKKKFREAIDKIKAWFKKIIENIGIRLTRGSEFVRKYEDAIREKAQKSSSAGYKVTMHEYKTGIDQMYDKYAGNMLVYVMNLADDKKAKVPDGDFVSKMYKSVSNNKASSLSELKDIMYKECVGKEHTNVQVKTKVGMMIDLCKNGNAVIEEIRRLEKIAVDSIEDLIKAIEKAEKNDDSNGPKLVRGANAVSSAVQQLATVCVDVNNKMITEYIGHLRGFMLYKPAKESYNPDEDLMSGGQSLFETAMSMV